MCICVYVCVCICVCTTRAVPTGVVVAFHRSNQMIWACFNINVTFDPNRTGVSYSQVSSSWTKPPTSTSMNSNKMAIARFSKVTAIWSYALCPPQSEDRSQCIPATFHKRYLLKSSAVHRPHEKGLLRSFVVIDRLHTRLSFAPHDIVLWHLRL